MSLKTKILVTTNLIILSVGLLIIILATTTVQPKLTDKLKNRGVSIARNIAEQIVTPLLTEQFFEIQMMMLPAVWSISIGGETAFRFIRS